MELAAQVDCMIKDIARPEHAGWSFCVSAKALYDHFSGDIRKIPKPKCHYAVCWDDVMDNMRVVHIPEGLSWREFCAIKPSMKSMIVLDSSDEAELANTSGC